jgi:hypothetical protein
VVAIEEATVAMALAVVAVVTVEMVMAMEVPKAKCPTCQRCGKEGHTVLCCFKRFDASFTGPLENRSTSVATTSYSVDTNWYTDTGATDHITGEPEKLTIRDK